MAGTETHKPKTGGIANEQGRLKMNKVFMVLCTISMLTSTHAVSAIAGIAEIPHTQIPVTHIEPEHVQPSVPHIVGFDLAHRTIPTQDVSTRAADTANDQAQFALHVSAFWWQSTAHECEQAWGQHPTNHKRFS